jgi:cell division protein FtsB
MVARRRLRLVLFALAFYAVAGGIVSYFFWHAQNGARGVQAKAAYKVRIATLNQELQQMQLERKTWEKRVALLGASTIDRDILDERARALLNVAHRDDVIVLLPRD